MTQINILNSSLCSAICSTFFFSVRDIDIKRRVSMRVCWRARIVSKTRARAYNTNIFIPFEEKEKDREGKRERVAAAVARKKIRPSRPARETRGSKNIRFPVTGGAKRSGGREEANPIPQRREENPPASKIKFARGYNRARRRRERVASDYRGERYMRFDGA